MNESRTCPWRISLAALFLFGPGPAFSSTAPALSGSSDDAIEFDAGALSKLGIDTSVAGRFAHAPRFMPGTAFVEIKVNGRKKGRASARFDADGRLCVSPALLRAAGLIVPPTLRDLKPGDDACHDYLDAFPQAIVKLHPDRGAIEFVVPADALDTSPRRATDYATGGVAGLFNYDLLSMTSRNPAGVSQFGKAANSRHTNVRNTMPA